MILLKHLIGRKTKQNKSLAKFTEDEVDFQVIIVLMLSSLTGKTRKSKVVCPPVSTFHG